MGKKVCDDTEEQQGRLAAFEDQFLTGKEDGQHISDADLIFLKQELARYKQVLDGIHGIKDQILDDAQKISECDMGKHIKPEEIEVLK